MKQMKILAFVLTILLILSACSGGEGVSSGQDETGFLSQLTSSEPSFSQPVSSQASSSQVSSSQASSQTSSSQSSSSQPVSIVPSSIAPVFSEEVFTLRYTTSDVNLRTGPGTTYAILATVPSGEAVKAYETQNGWTRVIYKNQNGYMNTTYLAAQPPLSTEDRINAIINGMTLEEKVGQMFFVRCRKNTAVADIKQYHPAGYILFANDVEGETPNSLKAKIERYQTAANVPLLIGVDEEGGTVTRVSRFAAFRSERFASPQDLFAQGGLDKVARDAREKSIFLKNLGFNVNLAPVCDLSTDPGDFIYPRAFGQDAAATSAYVSTVVLAMRGSGMGSTLKHFPGYGNNVDTHTGIAQDQRSYETFVTADFLPFEAGIAAGADSVLVSHNVVASMDPNLPASLSPKVHEILRRELGFHGVVMTDDLVMNAIRQYTGNEQAAVQAAQAGNDLLIATDFNVQIPAVVQAVKEGRIPLDQVEQSVRRVLRWKMRMGLLG